MLPNLFSLTSTTLTALKGIEETRAVKTITRLFCHRDEEVSSQTSLCHHKGGWHLLSLKQQFISELLGSLIFYYFFFVQILMTSIMTTNTTTNKSKGVTHSYIYA